MKESTAVRVPWIFMYDEQGAMLAGIPDGTRSGDALRGFIHTVLYVKTGNTISLYNYEGRQISGVAEYKSS